MAAEDRRFYAIHGASRPGYEWQLTTDPAALPHLPTTVDLDPGVRTPVVARTTVFPVAAVPDVPATSSQPQKPPIQTAPA